MEKLPGLNILERGLLGKFIPFPISPIIFQQMRTSFPVYHPGATPPPFGLAAVKRSVAQESAVDKQEGA